MSKLRRVLLAFTLAALPLIASASTAQACTPTDPLDRLCRCQIPVVGHAICDPT